MFDWFRRPEYVTPPTPPIQPLPQPTRVAYLIGPTDDNTSICMQLGPASLFMNKQGVQTLIQLLSVARDSLDEGDNHEPTE